MHHRQSNHQARLLCGVAAASLIAVATSARAETTFDIQPQPLNTALAQFGAQSGLSVLVGSELMGSRRSPGYVGIAANPEVALQNVLSGTNLIFCRDRDTYIIVPTPPCRQVGQEGGGGSAGDVDALIVTAQKKEEAIQDVPIAISAFSQKSLDEQKIEGGFDLLKAIPNVTFSKSNFSSYNFSIRGIGTKAISATTDPGVAVAFNNTTLIQNRLFEQEYFDVERVEVLRGPQGTLYGRNATSGVINVITAKPKLSEFTASVKLEGGSYDTKRAVGMVNIPIIDDMLAVRFAGAMTQRTGYDYNSITQNNINGRDLWSSRVSVGFEPNERIRADLVWEHFEEDDDRSRTGKQLCHRDPGPVTIDGAAVVAPGSTNRQQVLRPALFSQGCKPGSLYEDAAFSTPNGMALPFVFAPFALTLVFPVGIDASYSGQAILQPRDPYGNAMQSRDLRTIASFRDPRYRAKADLLELSVDIDLTDTLTFTSQTAYNEDSVYSFQDFNRFNSQPIFTDTSTLFSSYALDATTGLNIAPRPAGSPLGTAGVFCDPQLGCSDTVAGFDISQAEGRQFSQEFRLSSNFDGPVNFSAGANYTRFQTEIDYYVFYNIITALAMLPPFNGSQTAGNPGPGLCRVQVGGNSGMVVDIDDYRSTCPYVDPNPIESIDGNGHNYFRSRNPYKLSSAGIFGELYWNLQEDLKLTVGLRYTDDTKTFTPVPSQVLLAPGLIAGGVVSQGYPARPDIEQQWGEFTGRIGLDWKPVLPFTDQTLLYGFYSRGYKGGGANPPSPGFATREESLQFERATGGSVSLAEGLVPILSLNSVEYGRTFAPEFVNAFEVGAKNTLLDGAMTFNLGAFFYDYQDYQVSQIRDRTAVNENFDATVWGLEFETVFSPTHNLRINANLGYLDTKVADGESSIDIMDRTQGNPDYIVTKAWAQLPSNCVIPVNVARRYLADNWTTENYWTLCGGMNGTLAFFPYVPIDTNPAIGGGVLPYDSANYPEINGGAGIRDDLGGNELPNSPHWTTNIGVQYGFDMPAGWRATVRGDAYWQSQSFARIYNSQYDKLRAWTNANLSVWVEQPDWGLKVELYAKNIFDDTPITDAFLNSDDTALTTNVFVLDPRIVGLSIRKDF